MQRINIGDKILVPFEVLDIQDTGDYPYFLGYGTARIHASAEMLERFRQETGEEDSGKTYEDGMRHAWEMAKKIICNVEYGGLHTLELEQIFGYGEFDDVLKKYTPQEAAAKIAEWEEMQGIQVGDVIKMTVGELEGVVSKVKEEGCYVIFGDGSSRKFRKKDLIKTGRTIDIAGLLAQIGGAE